MIQSRHLLFCVFPPQHRHFQVVLRKLKFTKLNEKKKKKQLGDDYLSISISHACLYIFKVSLIYPYHPKISHLYVLWINQCMWVVAHGSYLMCIFILYIQITLKISRIIVVLLVTVSVQYNSVIYHIQHYKAKMHQIRA